MAAQPQTYGSIREFLDNLPKQPCIWQPENPNICVTCLRINEPIARVCSVWAQALDDAPLEEIDFEEEVKSLPSVVEIEDDFDIVEEAEEIQDAEQVVAEVDVVAGGIGLDIIPEVEPVVEEAVEAEPIVAETVPEEILDAVEAETIASENIEAAIETETKAIEAVADATDTVADAVEGYAEAVAEEGEAAETVVEAVVAEAIATEAVVEATEQVTELVESEASEEEVKEGSLDAIFARS